jgi:hypothetical protein
MKIAVERTAMRKVFLSYGTVGRKAICHEAAWSEKRFPRSSSRLLETLTNRCAIGAFQRVLGHLTW